jgi:hypothetical protein
MTETKTRRTFTQEHRANLSRVAKIKAALGENNAKTRQVQTPLGTFKSLSASAQAHNMSKQALYHRLNSRHFNDYVYVE